MVARRDAREEAMGLGFFSARARARGERRRSSRVSRRETRDGVRVCVLTVESLCFPARSCTRTAKSAATCPPVTAASVSTASTRLAAVWLVVSTITES